MDDFGAYLRRLRQEQKLTLREVEKMAGVSNSYLALIERGLRKPPGADVLKKLAPVYNVPVKDLLREAGYLADESREISEEEEIEMAFQFVMNDPRYRSGTRLQNGELSLNVKRFIVEMYEKATGKKLLT
jgi:transcriptional regulator with XRE-family HTH domain